MHFGDLQVILNEKYQLNEVNKTFVANALKLTLIARRKYIPESFQPSRLAVLDAFIFVCQMYPTE